MMRSATLLALSAVCALVAAPAGASIPGNIDQRGRSGLAHVCGSDTEPDDADYVQCLEHEADDPEAPFTAAECAPAGLDPVCVVDFVPKVKIKGSLLLFVDDNAEDSGGFDQPEAGFVLELKIHGKKQTLIELFDGTKIGNWNDFSESFVVDIAQAVEFKNVEGTEFQFASQNLASIGQRIRDLTAGAFPKEDLSGCVPVMTSITRDTKRDPVDSSGDSLGSGATFKIVLQFARVQA